MHKMQRRHQLILSVSLRLILLAHISQGLLMSFNSDAYLSFPIYIPHIVNFLVINTTTERYLQVEPAQQT